MKSIVTQTNVRFNEFLSKAIEIHGDKYDYSHVEYVNKRTKVNILCKEHGMFTCTPGSHLQRRGCPSCGRMKLFSDIDNFINKSNKVHSGKYDYSRTIYTDYETPLTITCPEHGDFEQIPRNHLRGNGCPKCGKNSSTNKLSDSLFDFIEKSNRIHSDKYDYSKVNYVNSKTKVIITCPEHGDFEQLPNSHLLGKGCIKCGGSSTKDFQDFIEQSNLKHNSKYDYSKVNYVNNKTKVEIICKEHGSFYQTPLKHISYGYGCPNCVSNVKSNTTEFIQKSLKIHKERFDYSKVDYVNNKTKVVITCNKHGDFEQLPNSHLLGHGCPQCCNKITKPHQKIIDYLDSLGVKYFNNSKYVLGDLEVDIFIPDYNFGIEVNGLYWHSLRIDNQAYHDRLKNLHSCKATLAENVIKLYQFWDYEIADNFDLICSMINHALNKSERIYARNCVVKRLTNNDVKDFFNISHMQGHRNASVVYGLLFDDELVASATFSKHHLHDWEVIRYANKLNCSIVGGFSRILKRFSNDEKPKSLLTFADRRFSTGGLYKKCGFSVCGVTAPNYFYYKNNILLSRQRCQKHKLHKFLENFDNNLTEHQNMYNHNYGCVYDAGHVKLIKNFDN